MNICSLLCAAANWSTALVTLGRSFLVEPRFILDSVNYSWEPHATPRAEFISVLNASLSPLSH